jgi:hypothetical protein
MVGEFGTPHTEALQVVGRYRLSVTRPPKLSKNAREEKISSFHQARPKAAFEKALNLRRWNRPQHFFER